MAKREKTQESKAKNEVRKAKVKKKTTTNDDIPRKNIENKSNITKKTETTTNQGIKKSKPKKTQSKTIKEIQGKSKDIQCNIVAKQRIQTKKVAKNCYKKQKHKNYKKPTNQKKNTRTNIESQSTKSKNKTKAQNTHTPKQEN